MFCTARGGSTPCFRRRRGRRPGHDCRVIYVVLPPALFSPPASVHPDANSRERDSRDVVRLSSAFVERDTRATCTYVLPFFYFREGPVLPTKVAGHWKVEGNPLPTRRNVPVCTASVAVGARGLGGIRGPLKLPGNRKLVLLLPFLTTPQRSRGCQIFFKTVP